MCENCRAEIVDILDKRIRRILAVSKEGVATTFYAAIAEAECFHLMEIQQIAKGEATTGVYDDYGPKPEPENGKP